MSEHTAESGLFEQIGRRAWPELWQKIDKYRDDDGWNGGTATNALNMSNKMAADVVTLVQAALQQERGKSASRLPNGYVITRRSHDLCLSKDGINVLSVPLDSHRNPSFNRDLADFLEALRTAPAPQDAELLWCAHVRGPDDVHAVGSYDEAVKLSDEINGVASKLKDLDVLCIAMPAIWPWSREAHAKDLAPHGAPASSGSEGGMSGSERLEKLIQMAKSVHMTPADWQEQRRSWLRGELGMEHPDWPADKISEQVDRVEPSVISDVKRPWKESRG